MNTDSQLTESIGSARSFVLWGEDTVAIERARDTICSRIEKSAGGLTHRRYDGSVASMAEFVQDMLTVSLFAETRVFHVRHAQELKNDEIEELAPALAGSIPDVYIIVEIDESKKEAAAVLKKLGAAGQKEKAATSCLVLEFARPADWAIPDWIVANAPLLIGRKIAKADAEYFADRIGTDLDIIHSELQKLDLHLPPGAAVNREAIDHLSGPLREMTQFELAAAVGRRDLAAALRIIEGLFSTAIFMPLVVSALARHFWALLRINKFLESNPDVGRRFAASQGYKNPEQTATGLAIGKAAGLLGEKDANKIYPVLIKSGIISQARSFTTAELSAVLSWLLEFDVGIKTGKIEDSPASLQLLCYRIIRVKSLIAEGAAA
jgi:DNA polymerase-3 subunit delta